MLALHGTVYARWPPWTSVSPPFPYVAVDRGLIVDTFGSMTNAAGCSGPLISIPALAPGPSPGGHSRDRHGLGTGRSRASVTFANAAGDANGTVPTVTRVVSG